MSERRRLSSPLIRALRFVALPLASLRQAEKQFPQADLLLFRRRFAPLTPSFVRASRFASANPAKEFFMAPPSFFAMLVPLSASAEQASLASSRGAELFLYRLRTCRRASGRTKFRRCLNFANICSRRLVARTSRSLASFTPRASRSKENRFVVSVISNNCANAGGVPDLLFCPTRVVSLSGGKLEVLGDIPDLLVTVSEADAPQSSARKATIATYDPQTHQITFANVDGSERTELPQKVVVEIALYRNEQNESVNTPCIRYRSRSLRPPSLRSRIVRPSAHRTSPKTYKTAPPRTTR